MEKILEIPVQEGEEVSEETLAELSNGKEEGEEDEQ